MTIVRKQFVNQNLNWKILGIKMVFVYWCHECLIYYFILFV